MRQTVVASPKHTLKAVEAKEPTCVEELSLIHISRHLEIQADARIRAEASGGELLDVAFRRIESARGMYAAERAAFFQVCLLYTSMGASACIRKIKEESDT